MALDWNIPKVEAIVNTSPEWIFSPLDPLDETVRLVVLMTMWRVWHVQNEITHEKAPPTAEASRRFLHGYLNSLLCIQQHPDGNLEKGKMVVLPSPPRAPESMTPKPVAQQGPRQRQTARAIGAASQSHDARAAAPALIGCRRLVRRHRYLLIPLHCHAPLPLSRPTRVAPSRGLLLQSGLAPAPAALSPRQSPHCRLVPLLRIILVRTMLLEIFGSGLRQTRNNDRVLRLLFGDRSAYASFVLASNIALEGVNNWGRPNWLRVLPCASNYFCTSIYATKGAT
ncbi:uncharacterized protein LOC119308961 [Triticum dicoccoides]|uniref:uncharacterized protein LOC119308961 n=1 Tax=Triticum dicoccoides TaxID=85692 RepID=UPI001890ED22|nr:uncharacterized protein LOC119308961 [Triticum dicoccoides]